MIKEGPQCPVSPRKVFDAAAEATTPDNRIGVFVQQIRPFLKTHDGAGLIGFTTSPEFKGLTDKQRSYILLFTLYDALYQVTGPRVIEKIKVEGMPKIETDDQLSHLLFGTDLETTLSEQFQNTMQTHGDSFATAMRVLAGQLNSLIASGGLNSGSLPRPDIVDSMYPRLGSEKVYEPFLFFTLTALSTFTNHTRDFTDALTQYVHHDPALKPRAGEILKHSFDASLRALASHAQAIEMPITHTINNAQVAMFEHENGMPVLSWDILHSENYTKLVQQYEGQLSGTLFEAVGCPMVYHPMLKQMLDAYAEHYAQQQSKK